MRKLFFLFSLPLFFSCSSNRQYKKLIADIDQNLIRSNAIIEDDNRRLLWNIESDAKESWAATYMKRFYAQAVHIQMLTDSVVIFYKQYLNANKIVDLSILQDRLVAFKTDLIAIDTDFPKELSNRFANIELCNDTLLTPYEIKNLHPEMKTVFIHNIINKILYLANETLRYNGSRYCSIPLIFDKYAPLITQNATHFKAGEWLEVTSGIGAFLGNTKLRVTINGSTYTSNSYNLSQKIKVKGKSGVYVLPITLQFENPQTGETQIRKENITYYVQ
jgi:hypothetical protein